MPDPHAKIMKNFGLLQKNVPEDFEHLRQLKVEDTSWILGRACVSEPELFAPERGGDEVAAKELCQACPVRIDCLLYAIANGIKKEVWGGLNGQERADQKEAMKRCLLGVELIPS